MALPPLPPTLHPILVHFAIGLVPAAAAFAFAHALRPEAWTRKAAYALLTAAALFALLAMIAGFRDYFAAVPQLEGTPTRDVLEWHERLGVISTILVGGTAIVAWWRLKLVETRAGWRWALAIALGLAAALVAITGWYGGSLVYDHGLSVNEVTPGV